MSFSSVCFLRRAGHHWHDQRQSPVVVLRHLHDVDGEVYWEKVTRSMVYKGHREIWTRAVP